MVEKKKITLMVVDDHPVVLEGLEAILRGRKDFNIVASAENGFQAHRKFRQFKPDVTLMDLRMPHMDGVEAIKEIRKIDPQARIIMLTTYDDEEDIFRAMEAGAMGYLLKDSPRETLVECIQSVYEGRIAVPPSIGAKLASRVTREPLSPRESQVLRLLAEGKPNREIAQALNITEGTVKIHVHKAMEKLGAKTRTAAARLAVERGLVRVE